MQQNQITVFVGDVDQSLAATARQFDPKAYLIDSSNYKDFLVEHPDNNVTAYTSLGDLPKDLEVFYQIAMAATKIVYAPPATWSDNLDVDPTSAVSSLKGLTEHMLLLISNYRPVKNLELCYFEPTANPVLDTRKSDNTQIWFAGCSITAGEGVELTQRYGHLVADSLGLPGGFLALNGSSIAWAADQILRADVKSGDIVVWGITTTERINYIENNRVVNIGGLATPDRKTAQRQLFSETTFYSHLYAIKQVINYCKKHQVKLLLLGLLTSSNILRFLKSQNNYFHFPHKLKFIDGLDYIDYVDVGTDNQHPGPRQHKLYKNFVLTSLEKL
jgi:hypothetical protein